MRHVEITHTYVLPIPEDDVEVLDPIVNSGVSMMEVFMREKARNMQDLHSDWKIMPKEYSAAFAGPEEERIQGRVPPKYADRGLSPEEQERDRVLSKEIIEADADHGMSFAGDVMGQSSARALHPWEQGLSIFPEGHPLRAFEDRLREDNEQEALEQMQALAPKLKELPPGDDESYDEAIDREMGLDHNE